MLERQLLCNDAKASQTKYNNGKLLVGLHLAVRLQFGCLKRPVRSVLVP